MGLAKVFMYVHEYLPGQLQYMHVWGTSTVSYGTYIYGSHCTGAQARRQAYARHYSYGDERTSLSGICLDGSPRRAAIGSHQRGQGKSALLLPTTSHCLCPVALTCLLPVKVWFRELHRKLFPFCCLFLNNTHLLDWLHPCMGL